jgi:mRNA interferase RelE/StbE
MYTIKWRPKALEELRKLPRDIGTRILHKVEQAQENPEHFLERLVNDSGFKVRVGDYRIIIDLVKEEKVLAVRIVGHRKNIYKKYL